jgi:hypothetical protein
MPRESLTYLDINRGETWRSVHYRGGNNRNVVITEVPLSDMDMVSFKSDIRSYRAEAKKFLKAYRRVS